MIATEVEPLLKELRLFSFAQNYVSFAKEASENKQTYEAYLKALAQEEIARKFENRIRKLISQAKFNHLKNLSEFNFNRIPKLKKQAIIELSDCHWIEKADNVCLMGQTGLGKTHLAVALGYEACKRKFTTRFYTTAQLVNELSEAKDSHSLLKLQIRLARYQLVIIDELGYIPLSKKDAELLFQFFSDRYEKGSIIVTTNLEFPDWTKFLIDPTMTAALLDRFTHHCHIFSLIGESFRFAQRNGKNK